MSRGADVVVVTGASAGVGRATVQRFARQGARLGLIARGRERLDAVPPIFQPEVAAQAIDYAAHHRRRQIYVGWPAVKAILADKVAPGLLDRILGRTGYRDQQLDEPVDPARPDNLFEPGAGEWAAHGRFDDRALDSSALLWVNLHREWLGLAVGAGTALAGVLSSRTPR